jgi:hypothetical protein
MIEDYDSYKNYYKNKLDVIYSKGRYIKNAELLYPLISHAKNILVVGDKTFIDFMFENMGLYDNRNVTYTNFDLRYEFPYDNESFDLIINCEVLEHIKDRDGSKDIDLFNFSGVDSFNKELRRVLTNNGKMFLTTPNSCSFKNLIKLLQHRTHLRFFYHVREYSYTDLIYMFTKYEFQIEYVKDFDVGKDIADDLHCVNIDQHIHKFKSIFSGYSEEMRGDTFYFILSKL